MTWILLVLLYGILKGVREVIKKKSLQGSTVMEVLVVYTLLAFFMVLPDAGNATGVEPVFLFWIAVKSFLIFLAWICSFVAIDRMPISFYGILDLSRVLFATLLGTIVLGEILGVPQIVGLTFVSTGLILLNGTRKLPFAKTEKIETRYVVIAVFSCILNAVSGLMDKILMRSVTSSQLQFWYMLFLVLFYVGYILITKTKIRWIQTFKNHWIWILSLLFIIADRALFMANGMEESRVTIMTLIKQSGSLVTILAGKIIFKEKNIRYKLICAGVVITGIVVAVM